MPTSDRLDVRVVFDARSRGRRGRVVRAYRARGGGRRAWSVVGAVNLVVAGVLCYAAWWRVDKEIIYPTLIMKTSFSGFDVGRSGVFVQQDQADAEPGTDDPGGTQLQINRKGIILWASAYGWLTLVTAAACALGLSGGALLGRAGGGAGRRAGVFLFLVGAIALGIAAYWVLTKYGMRYPSRYQRIGMGALVAMAGTVGLAAAGRVHGLSYLAAVMLILSGAGSLTALYLGVRVDAFSPEHTAPAFMAKVFAAQTAWGWLLLPITRRLRP